MPLTIQVEGINVYGTHGVYDQEKINGQNFRIDLLIELKENILNFDGCKRLLTKNFKRPMGLSRAAEQTV